MASLSDQIDRFARSSKAVKTIAASSAPARALAGPFTRAVLDTHLGDLIRDADPSELGLFQLIGPSHPSGTEKNASRPQVARVEFGNATPLRRTIHRRDDHTRNHVEPEIYAQAAIKYIDRYDPIRPMPRARSQAITILQRLGDVRQNIRGFLQSLERIQSEEVPPLKSLIEREEERTSKIKANIADLQQRKEIALDRRRPVREKTATQVKQTTESDPRLDLEPELSPVAPAKTLHFTDNLMDEVMDLSHISNISMATHNLDPSFNEGDGHVSNAGQTTVCQVEDGRANEHQDDTEMFGNAAANGAEDYENPKPLDSSLPIAIKKPSNSTKKVQINEDIERIIMKLWRSAPDIMGPIHQLDASGSTAEPPSAKEILARLRLLSQSHISPTSPSTATETSLSNMTPSLPTPQQILTAHLLHTLLLAPHCSLPLNKVKEELTTRASGGGGQSTSRIIYGCVAKRLVKIDRSGREQIVKFDI